MAKIEFNTYDLMITTVKSGDEVAQIKPSMAFDKDFIASMREQGVKTHEPKKAVSSDEDED